MPALIITRHGEPQLTFNLDRAETRVGRGTLNDLVIPDEKVSRHHFVIISLGGVIKLQDKSGRGVTINGHSVENAVLSDGDEIAFGETVARFVISYKAESAERNTNVDIAVRTDILSYSRDSKAIVTTRGWLTIASQGGRRIELSGNVINIGSAEGNQIRLDEKYISAFHCRIYKRGGRFFIRDLDSTNGTHVNGARVADSEIPEGAKIRVGKAEMLFSTSEETQKLNPSPSPVFQGMVGASSEMKEVFELVRLVAASDATVLVTGETGTGKELVSRALHRLSGRASGPFIPVNCAAIAKDVIESELFGHEKGAFTGAVSQRKGAFEEAEGGTLFLDEIADLSPDLQTKILRAIEYGEIKRVGANRPMNVSTRVVAATNRELPVEVAHGRFREDLYYRLSVIPVHLPPLRKRGDDVATIANHLMTEMTGGRKALTAEAHAKLLEYQWPGNVRELKNVLTRALVLSRSDKIGPQDLEFRPAVLDDIVESAKAFRPGSTLSDIEKTAVLAELARQGGHRERTAKALGIGLTTLKEKLREWGVISKKQD
jgi:DNA-binding NtrC family response regulator